MVRTALVLVAVALAPAGAGADTQYVSGRALDACQAFDTTLGGLEDGSLDGRTARARFLALWPVLRKAGPVLGRGRRWAWMFPLPGYDAGCFGLSYDPDGYRFLDGPRARGYAGLRLYIRDGGRRGLEDRTGRPEPVVSATDGVVVASHPYRRGDGGPWGGYCMVYDRRGGLFFLYGDLANLRVSPGQLVLQGEVLGWLGRTDPEVRAHDLGTQLRFEVHTFDGGLFYPVYPGRDLREAGHTEWPIPPGVVRPRFRAPQGPPPTPSAFRTP